MLYRRPRGVNDILPDEVGRWQYAEASFRELCRLYRYKEIRTPMFEETDLFVRAVGEETDIVGKEMYTFAYLENNLQGQDRQRLVKLYYIAPVFRYDRPQAGRYRQHHQCGAEAINSAEPEVDAEIIQLSMHFFRELGINQVTLLLNSVGCPVCRPAYIEALKGYAAPQLEHLCRDCQRRYNTNLSKLWRTHRCCGTCSATIAPSTSPGFSRR